MIMIAEGNQASRIDYLDVAKGIGIILVVWGHIVPVTYGIGLYIFSFHMPLFFLTSGILFYYKQNWRTDSFLTSLRSKIKGILYPYIVFGVLTAAIYFVCGDRTTALQKLIVTLDCEGAMILWFLPVLFVAEMLFILIAKYVKNIKIIFLIIAAMIAISFFFKTNAYESIDNFILKNAMRFLYLLGKSVLACIFLFAGYAFAWIRERLRSRLLLYWILMIASFAANIICFRFNFVDVHSLTIGNPLLFYLNALTGSFSIVAVSDLLLRHMTVLAFFGKNSLLVFATHMNFFIMQLSIDAAHAISNSAQDFVALAITMLLEAVLIFVVNKDIKFLVSHREIERWIASLKQRNAEKCSKE